jgi:hypothetical protein
MTSLRDRPATPRFMLRQIIQNPHEISLFAGVVPISNAPEWAQAGWYWL